MLPHERLEFEMAVDRVKELLPLLLLLYPSTAKNLKTYYDSLVKAGFSDEQALKIICHHGFNPIQGDSK